MVTTQGPLWHAEMCIRAFNRLLSHLIACTVVPSIWHLRICLAQHDLSSCHVTSHSQLVHHSLLTQLRQLGTVAKGGRARGGCHDWGRWMGHPQGPLRWQGGLWCWWRSCCQVTSVAPPSCCCPEEEEGEVQKRKKKKLRSFGQQSRLVTCDCISRSPLGGLSYDRGCQGSGECRPDRLATAYEVAGC